MALGDLKKVTAFIMLYIRQYSVLFNAFDKKGLLLQDYKIGCAEIHHI
jgi:hypothetical protein